MPNPNDREYTNGEITVFWKPDLCIHATICFMRLRKVFDPSKRPWINMKGATTQEIISIVDQCPTDALMWKWNKDLTANEKEELTAEKPVEEVVPAPVTEITLIEAGGALIKGKFRLKKQSGEIIETASQIILCRCGRSKNPPFCDGSHHNR
jgi:uncharacterized Fe-S cluster protein YjdI